MFRQILAASVVALMPVAANAAAVIYAGDVSIGVDDLGQLNPTSVTTVPDVVGEPFTGVRWVDPDNGDEYESTSHGCLCEGWGVNADGVDGYANNSSGSAGLTAASFTSTASTASVGVTVDGMAGLSVTHDFALSASDSLMEVKVTITNATGSDIADLKYRRVMDWDTSPTPFDEYVTIAGTATTSELAFSSDDGFSSGMVGAFAGDLASCGTTVDFTGCGPSDHGAVFDFDFGALADGASKEFSFFYGGALGKAAADAALAAVEAELASYGWSGDDVNQDGIGDAGTGSAGDKTPTFIFAFKGVGGEIIIPDPDVIPLPAGAWLLLGGLGALAGLKRRKKA